MRSFFLVLFLFSAVSFSAEKARVRPSTWAQEMINTELKNFNKISKNLYRSAQPDEDDFAELELDGFTDVLNLREYHSDNDEAKGTKLGLHRVKMAAGTILDEQMIEALRIIKNAKGAVLVHCWHGSDRTGVVLAMYRLIFQDWTRAQAIDELKNGGYGFHEKIYKNIPKYLKAVDLKEIKKKVMAP